LQGVDSAVAWQVLIYAKKNGMMSFSLAQAMAQPSGSASVRPSRGRDAEAPRHGGAYGAAAVQSREAASRVIAAGRIWKALEAVATPPAGVSTVMPSGDIQTTPVPCGPPAVAARADRVRHGGIARRT
jgi:hypothetical protein